MNSTFFDKLKKDEEKMVFQSHNVQKNKTKISFFYLGPKNNWKNILNKKLQVKISDTFKSEFRELGYK